MNTRNQVLLTVALVTGAAGAVVAYTVGGSGEPSAAAGHAHAAPAGPGRAAGTVRVDAERARRIGLTYVEARVQDVATTLRTVGNVTYDETRLAIVNPKLEGWVERLHVDFLGAPVRRGEPLMEVFSPMLVSAQEELVLARTLADRSAGGSPAAAARAEALLESARRRLRYLDIPPAVVAEVERTGQPRRTLVVHAPASGVVVEKSVVAGMRVMPGMDLYRIADLSRVWVDGEVFEKDLAAVGVGQHARVTFEAFPGEVFEARVAYLSPTIAVASRTARVRLELDNPRGRIRPGMYATVELHPAAPRRAVVVPRNAVHQTGQRAMVFVRARDGSLAPRDVRLGTVAEDVVEVVSGLAAGETVVASASFLIDAESQMGRGMESMPGMDRGGPPAAPPPAGGAAPAADPHAGMKM